MNHSAVLCILIKEVISSLLIVAALQHMFVSVFTRCACRKGSHVKDLVSCSCQAELTSTKSDSHVSDKLSTASGYYHIIKSLFVSM